MGADEKAPAVPIPSTAASDGYKFDKLPPAGESLPAGPAHAMLDGDASEIVKTRRGDILTDLEHGSVATTTPLEAASCP